VSSKKPLLIGINNPVSPEPEFALYPRPAGCTGHRIYEMLQSRIPSVTMENYIERFERRNLLSTTVPSKVLARESAAKIEQELWGSGRVVVLFGADVALAFGHPRLLLHPQLIGGTTWRQVPHPSGRNTWYNDQSNKFLVASLLEDLYNAGD
jgi:hypothetical protein